MGYIKCLVIVDEKPETNEEAEKMIAKILAPYDREADVEEYNERCWCVRKQSMKKSVREALQSIGAKNQDDLKKASPEDKIAYTEKRKELFKKYLSEKKPYPKCLECHGKGYNLSVINPIGEWKETFEIGGEGFDDPKGNIRPVSDFISDKIFWAVVSSEGGWDGISDNEYGDTLDTLESVGTENYDRKPLERFRENYPKIIVKHKDKYGIACWLRH